MADCPYFQIQVCKLLAIAGCVWLIAGVNVALLGVQAYAGLDTLPWTCVILSCMVFAVFGAMFYVMTRKHTARILNYPRSTKAVWHFFDIKAYAIMAVMMGGGIWLRLSGLVPEAFIAFFYTGLGSALALAGVLFWYRFFTVPRTNL